MPPRPRDSSKLSQFWQELKRRRVIHVIVVYATAAFVIVELVGNVYESLQLPDWTPTMVILLLVIGFPFALIFSWIYDISLKGVKKTERRKPTDGIHNYDNSIAVLPFKDMSALKDQDYFCEGISEEIINVLTQIGSLKVIARTSAFAFKDKQVDMREIGEKLNVETLLEGSIRKDGNHLRITAQLVNAVDGSHIWSNNYDRTVDDMFAIQDEIASEIAEALKVNLLGQERKPLMKRHTVCKEVYTKYLKGNYHAQLLTKKGLDKATTYYDQALREDPMFPLVYVGQAVLCWYSTIWGGVPPTEAFPKAEELVSRALELDSSLGEAYAVRGLINTYYHWDFKEAELDFKKALQLNPGSALIHSYYSYLLFLTERHDAAIAEGQRAQQLDPISCKINTQTGIAYIYGSKFNQAKKEFLSVISMNPGYKEAYNWLAQVYAKKMRFKKMLSCFEKAIELSDSSPVAVAGLAGACYALGKRDMADKLFEKLKKDRKSGYVPATCFYMIHIYRGEPDLAFDWIKTACIEHDSVLLYYKAAPIKKNRIPDEPRYNELMKEFGLV